jgi:WD40 repeat protein
VRDLALAPRGELLAVLTGAGEVHLWRIERRVESRLFEQDSRLLRLEGSADGALVAASDEEKSLVLWNLRSGQPIVLPEEMKVDARFALSPDSRRVALSRQGTVAVFGIPEGKVLWSVADGGRKLAFSPDGRTLAILGGEAPVRLLDAENGTERGELPANLKSVAALAFSPDGKRLAVGGQGKEIEIWDLGARQRVASFATSEESISALEYSPDGARLAVGGASFAIRLLDAANGQQLRSLEGHTSIVRSFSFSRDGRLLSSSGGICDGVVLLWNVEAGRLEQTFSSPGGCRGGKLSSDGKTMLLAVGPEARLVPLKLDLWNTPPGPLLKQAERDAGARLEGFGLVGR